MYVVFCLSIIMSVNSLSVLFNKITRHMIDIDCVVHETCKSNAIAHSFERRPKPHYSNNLKKEMTVFLRNLG